MVINSNNMSNIITDIKALQAETLINLQNSKSNNTIRAYKSDFNDFGLFCAKNGFKSLPTDPKIVSLYLTHLSTKEVKMSTLKKEISINRSYSQIKRSLFRYKTSINN
jgi:site-specific recombinase XerD